MNNDIEYPQDNPYESHEYRTKMYKLLRELCMGGTIHASCCNYPELSRLVHSLRSVLRMRIDEHYQESVHDRHHVWLPDKKMEMFHHCSYSVDAKAIRVWGPLMERHGELVIDKALFSKGDTL